MRFTTLCTLVAVAVITLSLDSSSDAGDVKETEVQKQETERPLAPLFQRTRTRTVNVEVNETPAPVAAQCGPNGCNIIRERVSQVVSLPRQRSGLLSRLFNRSSRRTVSVSRGCCR
jgi:hypothetical protein